MLNTWQIPYVYFIINPYNNCVSQMWKMDLGGFRTLFLITQHLLTSIFYHQISWLKKEIYLL